MAQILLTEMSNCGSIEFPQADPLFFDQIHEEAVANDDLRQAAAVNTIDDFRYVAKAFEGLVIERMEANENFFKAPVT